MDYNTVLNLNSIVYQIYNIDDFESMKKTVLSSIRTIIPCVCASILMNYEADSTEFCEPIVVPENYIDIENRYLAIQHNDGSLWVTQRKQTFIFRDSELTPDEERTKLEYYQVCLAPFGLHYSVDMTITDGNKILGIMSLYRTKAQGDFTNEELTLLRLLGDHLNARFSYGESSKGGSSKSNKMDSFISEYDLTSREAEILDMIFNGSDNDAISDELCISPNTLKKHLQNLYKKTGVSGRVQLKALK